MWRGVMIPLPRPLQAQSTSSLSLIWTMDQFWIFSSESSDSFSYRQNVVEQLLLFFQELKHKPPNVLVHSYLCFIWTISSRFSPRIFSCLQEAKNNQRLGNNYYKKQDFYSTVAPHRGNPMAKYYDRNPARNWLMLKMLYVRLYPLYYSNTCNTFDDRNNMVIWQLINERND